MKCDITRARERLFPIWRRALSLSWPIVIQQFLVTLMRTVDIIVTGLFSPAAVAAVGLADLYSDIPRQLGSAIRAGAIALVSQDTGRGAATTRDRAVTQALILAFLIGLPFAGIGILFAHLLIEILGASSEVVQLGGTYLMIVFAVAPMRVVGNVGGGALQGTGDTRTPMYINGLSNVLNICGTVGLGLGIGPLPNLGIVGVGMATAISRTIEAILLLFAIRSPWTVPSFAQPRDLTVTRQIISIGIPRFGEQMSISIAIFPFNALLLLFGTEVNAGFHIARRIYRQITAPLYRSFDRTASIIVGNTLGEVGADNAYFAGMAISTLGIVTMGVIGVILFVVAEPIVHIFSDDPTTIKYAVAFTKAFAVATVFFGFFYTFRGGLRGAGDTRTPFYAQFTARMVCMLGFSYVVSIVLDYGLIGVYAGIVLTYVWGAVVVSYGFLVGNWADKATAMMAERAET